MGTSRETALSALATLLAEGTTATVWRGTDLEREIPPGGMIEISEGDSSDTALLSPLRWEIDQQAEILVAYTAEDEHARDSGLDAILATIHTLVSADRTLGGVVDDAILGSPSYEAIEADGAAKVARLTCTLSFFTTGSPLG